MMPASLLRLPTDNLNRSQVLAVCFDRGTRGCKSVLVAIAASIAANIFLYGSTTMLIDSVQTSIWLLFWTGVASYLMAYATAEVRISSPAFVPRTVMLPEHGSLT